MRASVDEANCSGCAVCVDVAPEVFEMDENDIAKVIVDPVPADLEDAAREGADGCPSGAILIED
jgi:ferredoxin